MADHVDSAPYVEQTGHLDALRRSLELDEQSSPKRILWTCPVCRGGRQAISIAFVRVTKAVAGDPPMLDLICGCGHVHGDHGGCGYGAAVGVPDSALPTE